MLKQRNQIARTYYGQLAAEVILVERCDRPCHVPAVASTGDHDVSAVELRTLFDPIHQRANIFVRTLAQESIVELEEGFAVAA